MNTFKTHVGSLEPDTASAAAEWVAETVSAPRVEHPHVSTPWRGPEIPRVVSGRTERESIKRTGPQMQIRSHAPTPPSSWSPPYCMPPAPPPRNLTVTLTVTHRASTQSRCALLCPSRAPPAVSSLIQRRQRSASSIFTIALMHACMSTDQTPSTMMKQRMHASPPNKAQSHGSFHHGPSSNPCAHLSYMCFVCSLKVCPDNVFVQLRVLSIWILFQWHVSTAEMRVTRPRICRVTTSLCTRPTRPRT
jgi:hypothetical protein